MSMSANQQVHQKDTCMYKENYTTWTDNWGHRDTRNFVIGCQKNKRYIHIHRGCEEVGHQWVKY